VDALLTGNMQQVLSVLQRGIDSEEHREFAAQLAARGAEGGA